MHRRVVPLAVCAVVGCDPPPPAVEAPPPRWVYAPNPAPISLGELRGRLGRSQAPQLGLPAGITGAVAAPLRLATPFAVPAPGPARAILYGLDGDQPAIELIEVDAGRVAWRSSECTGPVVGVTEAATICADASEVRGIGHDGKRRWAREGTFLALTEDRIVIAGPGEAIVLGSDDGEELARVPLPRGVPVEAVMASCGDAGRELFASGQDGRLVRIAEAKGGPAIAWATPVGAIAELEACTGETILVRVRAAEPGSGGAGSVLAISRATGAITGRVDGIRGLWPARDGSARVEIATSSGVERWPRDLASLPERLPLPPLGELIAERDDLRFVRATDHTAVLLDRSGVRAHLPFAWLGAALGERSLVGTSWTGSAGETAHRVGLPARHHRTLRLPRRFGVAVPAELRDLPPAELLPPEAAIGKPDTAMHAVAAAALDPVEPSIVYAVTLEHAPADARPAGIASVDLVRRTWRWQRGDGCGAGTPVAIAVARDVVVCAARTTSPRGGTVTATSRDGASRWQWEGDTVDALEASGDFVLVHAADRLIVLDAATGHLRGRLASDDGAPVRAAAVTVDETTYAVTYERGRLVVRLPAAGLLAAWSLAIDGAVRALAPSMAGVLVELEDGDAYRVDLRTAEVVALPGLGLAWRAPGDLVTGQIAGGPIPGPPAPAAPTKKKPLPAYEASGRPARGTDDRPRLWTPIPAGPPLGDSLQVALFELTGGLRARNDYAVFPPIEPAFARGPAGSPLVVASGPGLREVLVLDPRTGAPVKRVLLPDDAARRLVFGTVVDGSPVAGALLAAPLRAVVF